MYQLVKMFFNDATFFTKIASMYMEEWSRGNKGDKGNRGEEKRME